MAWTLADVEARLRALYQQVECEELLFAPTTHLALLSDGFEDIFRELDPGRGEFIPEGMVEELCRPINRARAFEAIERYVAEVETSRSNYPVQAALHHLVDCAHARQPGSPLLIFASLVHPPDLGHGGKLVLPSLEDFFKTGFHPHSHIRRMLQPFESAMGIQKFTGERRANALVRGMAELAEALYLPYLRVVLALIRFGEGRWPGFPNKFGPTATEVHRLIGTTHPGLIDRRVVVLRNAASHNGWIYHPDADELEYWDLDGPHNKARVEDLINEVFWPAYGLSAGLLLLVASSYAARTIFLDTCFFDFFEEFAAAAQAANLPRQQRAIEALNAWSDTVFGSLKSFVAANA